LVLFLTVGLPFRPSGLDEENMKRKCLAVGIILLFIGTAIIPTSGQPKEKLSSPASRGHWLYVGGSGPGNYTSITSAIRDASNGDTIFVFHDSSPYYEHVTIDKKISLIGENKETTVIDGQNTSDVIHISSDHANLSGFTLTRGGQLVFPNYDDAGVEVAANYAIVTDNLIISNGAYGVLIGSYDNPDLHHNQISNNAINYNYYGVYLMWANSNTIRNNTICHNRYDGVYLSGSPCSSNKIIDNNISFNKIDGIGINDGSSNIMQGNTITSNNDNGMYIIWDSNGNKIMNNHVESNHLDGIYLDGKNGQVSGNTIEGNLQGGSRIG
jgi:parallel beta-helix repeat protein